MGNLLRKSKGVKVADKGEVKKGEGGEEKSEKKDAAPNEDPAKKVVTRRKSSIFGLLSSPEVPKPPE
eukprot:CAMPEP_0184363868 /NCGR_PEP_ID=MMETSP1089-20130417/141688_1 /TAXON_ID=38269 ORGANISM="Gloeochaete wittrockiana, Strain SAG46.84" /NCGR_SAMPLE_ID=MMETSP1089 /ASSEMBLY_ACC=CAM_ASM_000445 /LENGTH=66 /DNA_ID=CAMNT_0026704527 /DNA_START=17 /DNA_END=214 /DNA_ORIENTATION=+